MLLTLTVSAQELTPIHADAPKREMRAAWLTTLNGLDWPKTKATNAATREQQKRELCTVLDQLQAVGINTVLLQTRIRGSVIYPSTIEPWDWALTGQFGQDPGYDPLAYAIEETHRRGMELHAWVVTIPAFKTDQARKMGSKSLLKTHPELLHQLGGQYYLDPGMPATADYLVSICHEIVSRYDIDGLHFDYIRYPENATSFPDTKTFQRYGKGQTKAAWRTANITRIVRRIYEDTKAQKPWVKVSSSPIGKYADVSRFSARGWNARDAVHQDAQGWLREGIHDMLFPMMYFDGNHFYPFAADWAEHTSGRIIAPGLGIYFMHPQEKNWPLGVITRQLHYIREQGLSGQCYFRTQFLTSNVKGLYDYLQRDFYAYPALPPACTWIDSIAPSAPTALQTETIGRSASKLTWQPASDNTFSNGSRSSVRYNVYASTEWPVDISKAENLVATGLPECSYTYNRLTAHLYGMHFAVTAMDRAGNESIAAQLTGSTPSGKSSHKRLRIGAKGQLIFASN